MKYAVTIAAGTALLAACGTDSGSGGDTIVDGEKLPDASTIADVDWLPRTVTVDGKTYTLPDSAAADAHISFKPGTTDKEEAGGRSGGSVGCNSFGGDVEIDGDTVKITDVAQTEIGCADPLGAFEERFISVFAGTHQAVIDERDGTRTLTLTNTDGDSITLGESEQKTDDEPSLTGTRWNLGGDAYLTLAEDGTASGSLGCNTFHGKAAVKGTTIQFGRLSTTRMVCSASTMKTERELTEILTGKVAYQQERDSLTLTAASGDSVTARAESSAK